MDEGEAAPTEPYEVEEEPCGVSTPLQLPSLAKAPIPASSSPHQERCPVV